MNHCIVTLTIDAMVEIGLSGGFQSGKAFGVGL